MCLNESKDFEHGPDSARRGAAAGFERGILRISAAPPGLFLFPTGTHG
jgi:hypothetical protein